jgi:hypothetical protein
MRIHIERLSVEGLAGGAVSAAALQTALVSELSRLVAGDASFRAGLETRRVPNLACEQSARGAGPSALGVSAAGALHAGLSTGLHPGGWEK